MDRKKLSRRAFIRAAAASAVGVVFLGACEPKVVEKLVQQTVVVEKEKVVKETVIVAGTPKVVEKVVTPTAVPAPEIKGEITIGWGGDVEQYEKDPASQAPASAEMYKLVKEWIAKHPKVKVNWLSIPIDGNEYTYLKTQLLAGTLPDISWGYAVVQFFQGNLDLFYDFAQDIQKPNPYGKAATWEKEFPLGVRISQHPSIPPEKVLFLGNTATGNVGSVAFYYNKDMFAKAGITKRPETWAELMDASKKLQQAGFTAYFADGSTACCTIRWCFDWLVDQLFDPVIRQIAGAIRPTGCADQPRCYYITVEEQAWAITKGVWRADDPRYLEMVRLMKEWSPYWNKDWLAPEKVDYWLTKRVAMTQQGSGSLLKYVRSKERGFEFGTFHFPQVTKESSPYATGAAVRRHGGWAGGGSGNCWFVPMTTVKKGTLPVVLDLLQFLTAAPTNERWCQGQYPPCIPAGKTIADVVKDPVELDRMYGFFNPPPSPEHVVRYLGYPGSAADTFNRLFVQYTQDKITLEQFGKEYQAEFERQAKKLITDNPTWKTDQWPEA